MLMSARQTALVVDLNNFSRYPTVAIGYLTAILRQSGADVSVFSPLSHGVDGVVREPRVKPWGHWDQYLRYWSATTPNTLVRSARAIATQFAATPMLARNGDTVVEEFRQQLDAGNYDVVLISTYLMYFDICQKIADICRERSIPVIVGGPYFAQPEVRREWCEIPGLTAVIGGEVELQLPEIVRRAVARESLTGMPGVWPAGQWNGVEAAPLPQLDALPFPDYSDFPWAKYPQRIVPMITGRGCSWGACTFCSDVTSTAGRRFRSRSPANVCDEITFQYQEHDAQQFVFTDLKLNSDIDVWTTLHRRFQLLAPGATWVGSVHVDAHRDNGLTADDLQRAADAGMVRLTTGLESGSQRMLDAMKKGANLNVTSAFLRNAARAGISVRVTMIIGYPGETAADLRATAEFLERHSDAIERVLVNRFQIMTGTSFHRNLNQRPNLFPGVSDVTEDHRMAQLSHRLAETQEPAYRRQIRKVLRAAHNINRKPLMPVAAAFEGVM